MRSTNHQPSRMFSCLSPGTRIRRDHPLRAIRTMVDEVLHKLSPTFRRDVRERWPTVDSSGEASAGAASADAVLDPQRAVRT